jgi:hypothetical protein
VLIEGISPSPNSTVGGTNMARHLAYTPTRLQEGNGHSASDFKLLFGAFRSHRDLIGTVSLDL